MCSFDHKHMAGLPLQPPMASCSPFVRGSRGEKEESKGEISEWARRRQSETNMEWKWRKKRKVGRAVIKEGGSLSSRAAGLQAPCWDSSISAAPHCLLLHIGPVCLSCLYVCLFPHPGCLSFPPPFDSTGVIDQLVYWWLEEVEAIAPAVYITAMWFYCSLIAPYCLLVVDKRCTQESLSSLSSFLSASLSLMVTFVFQMHMADVRRLNRYVFCFFLFHRHPRHRNHPLTSALN